MSTEGFPKGGGGKTENDDTLSAWEKLNPPQPDDIIANSDLSAWEKIHAMQGPSSAEQVAADIWANNELSTWEKIHAIQAAQESAERGISTEAVADDITVLTAAGANKQRATAVMTATDGFMKEAVKPRKKRQARTKKSDSNAQPAAAQPAAESTAGDTQNQPAEGVSSTEAPREVPAVASTPEPLTGPDPEKHLTVEAWKKKFSPTEMPVVEAAPAPLTGPDPEKHMTIESWRKKYSPTEMPTADTPSESLTGPDPAKHMTVESWVKKYSPTEKLASETASLEVPPESPEVMARAEQMRQAIAAQKEAVEGRIPEKHRSFFSKFDAKLSALSERWAKQNWKTKAAVGGALIGLGIAGGATGFVPLVAGAYAGSRLLGFLGGYALVDALTKKETRDTRTARWARIGGGLAASFAVPLAAQEAAPHILPYIQSGLDKMGISQEFRDCFASWFRPTPDAVPQSVPTPLVTEGTALGEGNSLENFAPLPTDPPPVSAEDFASRVTTEGPIVTEGTALGEGNSLENFAPLPTDPPPVSAEDFADQPGSDRGGAFGEPSPEMTRYFTEPIKVKPGDSIWGLIQEKLGANGTQADVLKRVEFLRSLPPEQLKGMGIGRWEPAIRGWIIHPGDMVDLKILDTMPLKSR